MDKKNRHATLLSLSAAMAPQDRELMRQLGRQVTLWAFGCDPAPIDDPQLINNVMEKYALENRLTVRDRVISEYEPQGVTVALVLMESHIMANSWPEHGVIQIEVFSCTDLDVQSLRRIAEDVFKSQRVYIFEMK